MTGKHLRPDKPANVFGEKVRERWRKDPWHVPKKKRLGFDLEHDQYANALDAGTGDDMGDWQPGVPVE